MVLVKYKLKLYQIIFTMVCLLSTNIALAGPNGILIVDLDRAYNSSKFGQSIRRDFQLNNESFNKENSTILESLKEEEIKLTKDRESLSPEDFAKAAVAFDTRAVAIRAVRLEKIRIVDERFKGLKLAFFDRIRPIIVKIMREYDASVILEKNSVVWSLASIDITSVIVERVDKAFMKTSGAQKPELED